MLRYLFAFLILINGLIHVMGFSIAFGFGNITQLTKNISKPAGILWLITAVLFIIATILFMLKKESWSVITFIAIIISQVLIITVWKDAKWGTIANIIILLVAIGGYAGYHFESTFRKDVKANLMATNATKMDLLTDADIQYLPLPVQRYIRYSGALNQPKVKNVKVVLYGEMRSKTKGCFKFKSVQYNFFNEPARLFFMKAKMFGIEVPGYHHYQNGTVEMKVKLFGLFPVMQATGPEMNKAETVTLFNDMCLMAPATLIDKRIQWETLDSLSAKATFTNGVNKITAALYFNEQHQLVNFISDDRYDIGDMKQYRFSTPVKEYNEFNGRNIFSFGEGVWHYPEGEFVYGKFYLKDIKYNVTDCP
ncbi:MAG TPA: DUF6544 family protein [Hanamia sp.]|nr:DUF6544 family protein [Hanamia sp.]